MPDVRWIAEVREHGKVRGVRAEEVEGALRAGGLRVAGGAGGAIVRRALIRYLRWSSRQHWAVKVMTAILVMPIYILTPDKAWDRLVDEAFGRLP